MKALVTGARGMLGVDLCRELRFSGNEVIATDSSDLDIRIPAHVKRVFKETEPDIVYHLAAMTDVDACEKQPEEAYRTNTVGTQIVALACQAANIPMIYISTISVFDGCKCEPYLEFDTPNPQSEYSRSKHEGEKIIQSLLQRYYIIRAGWMFGGGPHDKKFVAKIIDLAKTRSELKIVTDKFGSPTYTRDFSRAAIRLGQTGFYGLYHSVNTGEPCSRFEFARTILQLAGVQHCKLTPVASSSFPLSAPRPRMEAGRNLHLELLGLDLMRDWRAALEEYINQMAVAYDSTISR